ncbi:helicase associated domain-containing protein [Streptomyces sp. NPDC054783]
MNYEAAKQFYERAGHLRVPRKHVERIVGEDQEERELRLEAWISNQRIRAATCHRSGWSGCSPSACDGHSPALRPYAPCAGRDGRRWSSSCAGKGRCRRCRSQPGVRGRRTGWVWC